MSAHDVICLSHLRWDLVFQRPQHLLGRCARDRRVFYVEEPMVDDGPPRLEVRTRQNGVRVVVPHLPGGLEPRQAERAQRGLLDGLLVDRDIDEYVCWYYTPMALGFSQNLSPVATVYDCMDELSAFLHAPPLLRERERLLLERADVVFTGGHSLYEAKRGRHPEVYPFPSSVDVAHFAQARSSPAEPADQRAIARPRLGFYGVIDERLDVELIRGVAEARPDWQVVLVGPVAKIDPGILPRLPNVHYLESKAYDDLPAYLAGWDVALLPFACNEATRYISPTKTPEYLAAGRPVISTPIRDVIRPYGDQGLARIASTVPEFVDAVEVALAEDPTPRLAAVDRFLAEMSWDRTWQQMWAHVEAAVAGEASADRSEGAVALAGDGGATAVAR
jgi:glycosyltransferase involved in cell wall biosynthesis